MAGGIIDGELISYGKHGEYGATRNIRSVHVSRLYRGVFDGFVTVIWQFRNCDTAALCQLEAALGLLGGAVVDGGVIGVWCQRSRCTCLSEIVCACQRSGYSRFSMP